MASVIGRAFLAAVWVFGGAGVALAAASADPIPEPTSLALLAAGISGAALLKIRRRK